MKSAEFKEVEIKHYANPSSLDRFDKLCRDLGGEYLLGAGADCYWAHTEYPNLPFIRHRYSESNGELTVKTKVSEADTVVRNEVNLTLPGASLREVEKLLELQGYRRVLEIAKLSHVYFLEDVVLSWYTTMDLTGRVLVTPQDGLPARFVEIELREDINWVERHEKYEYGKKCVYQGLKRLTGSYNTPDEFCRMVLQQWADKLLAEGIFNPVHQDRIPESIWDMFGAPKLR